jgi:hypothetical protein
VTTSPRLALVILALLVGGCSVVGGKAPEPTPGIGPVGQQVEYEQVALTVNTAERLQQIGEASTPGAGNTFVLVSVAIKNDTDHKISYSRYQFQLLDDQGRSFDALAVPGQERPLLNSDLEAQKDVSGTVAFRVPANVGPLLLQYDVPGATAPIRVDLGS